jgi:hypothetical protein
VSQRRVGGSCYKRKEFVPLLLPKDISPRVFHGLCLLLALIKLWLVRAHLVMVTMTPHDDLLFIRHAENILNGKWLGDYNQLTLIKEPFFPLFIALSQWLSLPLLFSIHLFYVLACWLFIVAVRPLASNRLALLFCFLLLLLNPGSYNYPAIGRIFQLSIYAPLALVVMSCLLGLAIRAFGPIRLALIWSLALGVAVSIFWITRGESIFLIPSLALVFLYLFCIAKGATPLKRWGRPLLFCLLPVLLLLGTVQTVRHINMVHYGVPAVIEIVTPEFEAAYGGLLRIITKDDRQFIPVTRAARFQAYEISPTFRKIKDHLDGPVGMRWQSLAGENEIPAAFFIWAFRDSVAAAGYYDSGAKVLGFYRQMGEEIAGACDAGRLECRTFSSSLVPPWRPEYNALVLPTVYSVLKKTVTYDGFNGMADHFRNAVPKELMQLFAEVTGEKLLSSKRGGEDAYPYYFTHLNREKMRILGQLGHIFQIVTPPLALAALVLLLVNLIRAWRRRHLPLLTVFSVAAATGVMGITAVMTLLAITSYSEIARVMHVSFPLLLLFISGVFLDFLTPWPNPTIQPAESANLLHSPQPQPSRQ